MELELAACDGQTRMKLQPRVRKHRVEFDALKRKFMQLKENYQQQKTQKVLLGAQSYDRLPTDDDKIHSHTNRLMKQNEALEGAIRIGHETGNVAIDIERNLGDQNMRAKASREKVKRIQGMLGDSDSIVTRMLKRERLNKLILSGVCVLLVMALAIILYFKLIK
eukprot:TRINITY_DN6425_c0_g1_i1.p1 TRINITY_DN6425_c0_g1~~TRINITY_DN6425_c0_g1_i1.p1  ORF type:complete len:165 (+),score=48.80 TRINITY_DN6425_c0_g1_i1:392-886(+)